MFASRNIYNIRYTSYYLKSYKYIYSYRDHIHNSSFHVAKTKPFFINPVSSLKQMQCIQ